MQECPQVQVEAGLRGWSQMRLVVNGADVEVDDRHAETPLLWALRGVQELRGTKFGCGAGAFTLSWEG
jgi:aerobic-type carbon monoxide dehydrogenase small subunit (CoxS/CutS family)